MTKMLFMVRDALIGFRQPMIFGDSEASVIRDFRQVCNDSDTEISKSLHDFTLWYMGEFNIETGEITGERRQIASAVLNVLSDEV